MTIKDTSVVQFMTLMNDNNRNKVLLINIMPNNQEDNVYN